MAHLPYTIPDDCNPVFSNKDGLTVDIDAVFGFGRVRHTAAKSDPGYEHSEEIYVRAIAGEFGEVAPYVEPPLPPELTPVEKLAAAGLTVDDLKALLAS